MYICFTGNKGVVNNARNAQVMYLRFNERNTCFNGGIGHAHKKRHTSHLGLHATPLMIFLAVCFRVASAWSVNIVPILWSGFPFHSNSSIILINDSRHCGLLALSQCNLVLKYHERWLICCNTFFSCSEKPGLEHVTDRFSVSVWCAWKEMVPKMVSLS